MTPYDGGRDGFDASKEFVEELIVVLLLPRERHGYKQDSRRGGGHQASVEEEGKKKREQISTGRSNIDPVSFRAFSSTSSSSWVEPKVVPPRTGHG